jgi:hypothetical protein
MYLIKNKLSGIFLALSLLLGIGMFSAVGVKAQDVWRQNREDRDWNRDRANRRDHDRDYDRDDRRGNGRKGRGRYGRYGQSGRAGYGNYGNYGNYGYNNIYQVAQQQGYRDGLYTGSSDAQRGQSYNPQRSHFYKEARSGYNSSYGYRGQYQQAYRQGFLQGYQQGFQQYGGYNRNGNYSRRWPW